MACRLRFCRKLDVGEDGAAIGSPTTAPGPLEQLDLDAMLRWVLAAAGAPGLGARIMPQGCMPCREIKAFAVP